MDGGDNIGDGAVDLFRLLTRNMNGGDNTGYGGPNMLRDSGNGGGGGATGVLCAMRAGGIGIGFLYAIRLTGLRDAGV